MCREAASARPLPRNPACCLCANWHGRAHMAGIALAHYQSDGRTPMSVTDEATSVAYDLDGSLLEVCSCDVLCPCWIGEDPDNGTCESVVAYHFDSGTIRGVDVGGLTLASAVLIPGNVLEGNWKQVIFI